MLWRRTERWQVWLWQTGAWVQPVRTTETTAAFSLDDDTARTAWQSVLKRLPANARIELFLGCDLAAPVLVQGSAKLAEADWQALALAQWRKQGGAVQAVQVQMDRAWRQGPRAAVCVEAELIARLKSDAGPRLDAIHPAFWKWLAISPKQSGGTHVRIIFNDNETLLLIYVEGMLRSLRQFPGGRDDVLMHQQLNLLELEFGPLRVEELDVSKGRFNSGLQERWTDALWRRERWRVPCALSGALLITVVLWSAQAWDGLSTGQRQLAARQREVQALQVALQATRPGTREEVSPLKSGLEGIERTWKETHGVRVKQLRLNADGSGVMTLQITKGAVEGNAPNIHPVIVEGWRIVSMRLASGDGTGEVQLERE